MSRTRAVFALIILGALVIVGAGLLLQAVNQESTKDDDSAAAGTPLPADAVVVEIHSSNTKQDWMDQVVASFNAGGHTVNGQPIAVTVAHVGSGSSMNNILDGKIKPVVWSPGSDLWVITTVDGKPVDRDVTAWPRLDGWIR